MAVPDPFHTRAPRCRQHRLRMRPHHALRRPGLNAPVSRSRAHQPRPEISAEATRETMHPRRGNLVGADLAAIIIPDAVRIAAYAVNLPAGWRARARAVCLRLGVV